MKIIPLSEGVFTIDKSKIFIPFDITKDELQARKSGSLLVKCSLFNHNSERYFVVGHRPWFY